MRTLIAVLVMLAAFRAFPAEKKSSDESSLIAFANRVELRSSVEHVQGVTAKLGNPTATTYAWCNTAGCVDRRDESDATRMTARWTVGRASLLVELCHSWFAVPWQVVRVAVYRSTGTDAWGRSKKPVALFESEYEQGGRFCLARN
jgi:hypothetical protein